MITVGAWQAGTDLKARASGPVPICVADLLVFQEASAPAASQGPPIEPAPTDGDFHTTFAPAAWLARVRGNTTFGGPNFTVDDELALNGMEASISGELSFVWGGFYKAMLTGWNFSTSAATSATQAGAFGGAAIALGDQLSNSFSAAGAGGEFDITLWRPYADQKSPWGDRIVNASDSALAGGSKADLRLKAIGAVRWYSASLTVDDLTSATSGSWSLNAVMPGIGGGVELDIDLSNTVSWIDSISFEAAGGTGSNFVNEQYYTFIRAGLAVHFTPNVEGTFGYRLEDFKLANSSAVFDGGVQGLFIGANFKF